jgi:thiol-disulfide isomerase/thioredoxin
VKFLRSRLPVALAAIIQVSVLLAATRVLAAPGPGELGSKVHWTDVALLDGKSITANELRDNVVVVQIWASWCPFCGAQNPYVQKLADEYRGKGLLVLALSIDSTEQAARDYLARRGYTFNVAMQTQQADAWFGPRRTVPETYVIDRTGRIVFVQRGEMFPEDIAALGRYAAR